MHNITPITYIEYRYYSLFDKRCTNTIVDELLQKHVSDIEDVGKVNILRKLIYLVEIYEISFGNNINLTLDGANVSISTSFLVDIIEKSIHIIDEFNDTFQHILQFTIPSTFKDNHDILEWVTHIKFMNEVYDLTDATLTEKEQIFESLPSSKEYIDVINSFNQALYKHIKDTNLIRIPGKEAKFDFITDDIIKFVDILLKRNVARLTFIDIDYIFLISMQGDAKYFEIGTYYDIITMVEKYRKEQENQKVEMDKMKASMKK